MKSELYIALGFVIALLLLLHIPKGTEECECFGTIVSDLCIGVWSFCDANVSVNINTCSIDSCQETRTFFGLNDQSDGNRRTSSAVNLVLVMDTSFSMKGQSINQTVNAASQFVKDLRPQDKAAIITFDNQARLVHDFTTNKEDLIASIKDIDTQEDTRYLPALDKAADAFNRIQTKNSKNLIIFLSDGAPLDDSSNILSKAAEIKRANIDIFTVWFGNSQAKSDQVLRDMATTNEFIEGFYSSNNTETLYNSFKEIYDFVVEDQFLFEISTGPVKPVYLPGEKVQVMYSPDRDIQRELCNAEVIAGIDIVGESGKVHSVSSYIDGTYYNDIEGLEPGNYTLFINLSIQQDNCDFSDYHNIGQFTVIDKAQKSACMIADCEIIEEYLTDFELASFRNEKYEKTNRIILVIDTSESVGNQRIEKLKENLPYFYALFTKNSEIAIVTFSDEAHLKQLFTRSTDKLNLRTKEIATGGSTQFNPVLDKIRGLLSEKDDLENYVIIISDGVNWDQEENTLRKVRDIDNACIYTVGYGIDLLEDDPSKNLLREIAEISQKRQHCGEYIHSYESNLAETIRTLYKKVNKDTGALVIDTRVNKQHLKQGDSLITETVISSDFNGLRIPAAIDNENCLPAADVHMTLRNQSGIIVDKDLPFMENYNHLHIVNDLSLGTYEINVTANVLNCSISGERSFTVTVTNGDHNVQVHKLYYYIPLTLLLVMLVLVVHTMSRSLAK